jgi:exonuclease-1
MDKDGYGKEICISNLPSIQKPSFLNFTQSMLRQLCILAGCDYVSSLSGLGIKTAHSLIKKHKTIDRVSIFTTLEYILTLLLL